MASNERLSELRAELAAYFQARSRDNDVKVDPTHRPERDNNLAFRLYEEARGNRLVVVAAAGHLPLSAFTKVTGVEDELMLLYITVSEHGFTEISLDRIWRSYLAWIHLGYDEQKVLQIIEEGHGMRERE